ncbi:hypothetical protein [Okeania sp. SIO1I7]|nr:hypothetical protein [Okeania sp. SIO1I7]NET27919.1 hypothetical protein [Okeania sp. SIO1I7]
MAINICFSRAIANIKRDKCLLQITRLFIRSQWYGQTTLCPYRSQN